MSRIVSFKGPHFFLSNFYPCEVAYNGHVYKSSEHAYMAAKTPYEAVRAQIAAQPTPGKAKRMGGIIELREGWDEIRIPTMRAILISKFRHAELWEKLQQTAPYELIEGNMHHDTFWGECPLGVGQNNLGKLLMAIRDDISARFGV